MNSVGNLLGLFPAVGLLVAVLPLNVLSLTHPIKKAFDLFEVPWHHGDK